MIQVGGDLDLADKPLGAERGGELALEAVAVGEGVLGLVGHGAILQVLLVYLSCGQDAAETRRSS
jgi:hypothetical protein